MNEKDKIIFTKILNYIIETKSFIDGFDYETFIKDRKTINACVFDLSQIGELITKVDNSTLAKYPTIERRGIKGLRNRIVHDYDGINLKMVWGFLTDELDKLEVYVDKMLNEKN